MWYFIFINFMNGFINKNGEMNNWCEENVLNDELNECK